MKYGYASYKKSKYYFEIKTIDDVYAMSWEKLSAWNLGKCRGIYMIIDPSVAFKIPIVYVGQSENIRSRLSHHKHYDKDSHEVMYLNLDSRPDIGRPELSRLEYEILAVVKPPLNGNGTNTIGPLPNPSRKPRYFPSGRLPKE